MHGHWPIRYSERENTVLTTAGLYYQPWDSALCSPASSTLALRFPGRFLHSISVDYGISYFKVLVYTSRGLSAAQANTTAQK